VWLLAIAPWAVDILAQGGDNPRAFQNGALRRAQVQQQPTARVAPHDVPL
jgi:hypothetical protein